MLKSQGCEGKTTGTGAHRICVYTITDHIRMRIQNSVFELPAGHLLALDRGVPHDVEAMIGSAFLLTLAWPDGKDGN